MLFLKDRCGHDLAVNVPKIVSLRQTSPNGNASPVFPSADVVCITFQGGSYDEVLGTVETVAHEIRMFRP